MNTDWIDDLSRGWVRDVAVEQPELLLVFVALSTWLALASLFYYLRILRRAKRRFICALQRPQHIVACVQ